MFSITNGKDKNNKERQNFDSKIVLFCLAVSDFTIINVRGNFDKNTEKILKICHEKNGVSEDGIKQKIINCYCFESKLCIENSDPMQSIGNLH
jgi:hypothetical protein